MATNPFKFLQRDKPIEPLKFNDEDWDNSLPVATFHGFNDDCESDGKYRMVEETINSTLQDSGHPGIYVQCILINPEEEKYTSIFSSMRSQVKKYCEAIQNHPIFSKSDINIIGYSQGNMVARYII
jgi:predicted esterase